MKIYDENHKSKYSRYVVDMFKSENGLQTAYYHTMPPHIPHNHPCNVIYERRNACLRFYAQRYRLEPPALSTCFHVLPPPFLTKNEPGANVESFVRGAQRHCCQPSLSNQCYCNLLFLIRSTTLFPPS